jgi:ubiquinone/menaquinone biosynthesis C-methylase UbiE
MRNNALNFWQDIIYTKGNHLNHYPYDRIVSFIYNYYPRSKQKINVQILEIGSGAGNNLWFAAREGFAVTGIEFSEAAIEFSKKRFLEEGLKGEFIICDFIDLPLKDEKYDLVFDRASITCCSFSDAQKAINEVYRVLKNDGFFFFNPYSSAHTSLKSGIVNADGTIGSIKNGTLVGIENIYFFNKSEIEVMFPKDKWNVLSINHTERVEQHDMQIGVHAEWEVVVQKK